MKLNNKELFAISIFVAFLGLTSAYLFNQELKKSENVAENKLDQSSQTENQNPEPTKPTRLENKNATATTLSSRKITAASKEDDIINFFKSKSGNNSNWQIQKDVDGNIVSIMDGEIKDLDSDSSVKAFVSEASTVFNVDPKTIQNAQVVPGNAGGFDYRDVQQTFNGYDVFEGRMRVMTNKQTGNGFMFNNELKQVLIAEIPDRPSLSLDQVTQIIETQVGPTKKYYVKSGPIIWANSSPNDLAYRFHVKTRNDTLEIIISATTGRILLSRSTVMY